MLTTAKYELPYPELTDPTNVNGDIQALAEMVDAIFAGDAQGTIGTAPAAGRRGFLYTTTDDLVGTTYRDDGVGWRALGSRIRPAFTADVGFIVRALAAQTADTWRVEDGANNVVAKVGANGAMAITPTPGSSAAEAMLVQAATAGQRVITAKMAAGQTANPISVQDSTGTPLAAVTPAGGGQFATLLAGNTTLGATSVLATLTGVGATFSAGLSAASLTTAGALNAGSAVITNAITAASLSLSGALSAASATIGGNAVLTAASAIPESQVTNLTTDLNAHTAAINLRALDSNTVHKSGGDIIQPSASNVIHLAMRGVAGQTAHFLAVQNSDGSPAGQINANAQVDFKNGGAFGPAGLIGGALNASAIAAGGTALIARGFAGQTADIFQAQNSAGGVLAAITASGGGFFQSLFSAGQAVLTTASAIPESQVTNLVSDLAARALDSNTLHRSGGEVLTTPATGTTNMTVRAIAGQTAPLADFADGFNTKLSIWKNGSLSMANGDILGQADSGTNNVGAARYVLKADGAGTGQPVLDMMVPAGYSPGQMAARLMGTDQATAIWYLQHFGSASIMGNVGRANFFANASTTIPATFNGAAGQTSDLAQWKDSVAAILAKVMSDGTVYSNKGFQLGSGADAFASIGSTDAGTFTATSYTSASTGGSVISTSIVVPPSGRVLCLGQASIFNSGANRTWWGLRLNGAGYSNNDPADNSAHSCNGTNRVHGTTWRMVSGATPGATLTVTGIQKVSAGTGTIDDRSITLIPLP